MSTSPRCGNVLQDRSKHTNPPDRPHPGSPDSPRAVGHNSGRSNRTTTSAVLPDQRIPIHHYSYLHPTRLVLVNSQILTVPRPRVQTFLTTVRSRSPKRTVCHPSGGTSDRFVGWWGFTVPRRRPRKLARRGL